MNKTTITKLIAAALLLIAVVVTILNRDSIDSDRLIEWVENAGGAGTLIFILVYVLGTLVFFPGSILTLTGGALFGPLWGTLYNLTAATIGATLAFVIARYFAGDWVEQKAQGKFNTLKESIDNEGWRFVAFVRLVPLFPFNLLNYALGLTRIPLLHYIITSYLCMLPGTLAYTYLGFAGREAVTGGEGLVQKILIALALLAVAAFLPRFISRLRGKPVT